MKKIIIYVLIPFQIVFYFLNYYQWYSQTLPVTRTNEYRWIGRSFFFELFIQRDWHNPLWKSHSSYEHPKLAEYYLGAFLYSKYLAEKPIANPDYDMAMYLIDNNFYFNTENVSEEKYLLREKTSFKWWERKEKLNKKEALNLYGDKIVNTINIIELLRKPTAFVLAMSVVVFYFMMLTSYGLILSLLGTFLYGHNMVFLEWGVFATAEAMFILFFNLSIYFLIEIFRREKKRVFYLLGFAASVAFCTQAKLNGVMLLFFFNILYLLEFVIRYYSRLKINLSKRIAVLILVNTLSFCIFTLSDPYLYSETLKNIGNYYSHRWANTLGQTKNEEYRKQKLILPNHIQRIEAIYNNFTGKNVNMDSSFVSYKFPFGQLTPSGNLLVILLTIGILSTIMKTTNRKRGLSAPSVLLLLFIMIQLTMSFYLMLNFSRYFILLIGFFLFFEIAGAVYLSKLIIKSLRKNGVLYRLCINTVTSNKGR